MIRFLGLVLQSSMSKNFIQNCLLCSLSQCPYEPSVGHGSVSPYIHTYVYVYIYIYIYIYYTYIYIYIYIRAQMIHEQFFSEKVDILCLYSMTDFKQDVVFMSILNCLN